MEVKFYEDVKDELLRFAVVIAKHDGKWVLCKHKERETLECPGGHRETGELILETAKRELMEETGDKAYVHEMCRGVIATIVEVYRHPFVGDIATKWFRAVVGIEIAPFIPAAADVSVQRVGLALSRAAAGWASSF